MSSRLAVLALITSLVLPSSAGFAATMERACNKSSQAAASRSMCNCIQQVADYALSKKDQRLAAKFFTDPHLAQDIRQSDSRNHEAFWKRYKDFASIAAASCRAAG